MHDPPSQPVGDFDLEYFVERDATPTRTHAELYHNHLPKLDAAGFVDWDPQANTIARGASYEEIEPVLEVLETHRDELPGEWPGPTSE